MLILCMINISFKAGIWADGLIQDFSVSGKAIFYSTCQTFMDGAVHFSLYRSLQGMMGSFDKLHR